MRGLALGLALTAACYAPAIPSQVPCSPSGECPAGQMCVAGICVVRPGTDIDAPPGDRDGDGHTDAADNCAGIGNADQANEDGDPFGDVCDLCPHVVDSAQADGDSDGIGDACDASASKASLWLFEGFRGGVPWVGSTNWVPDHANDNLRVSAPGGDVADEFLVVPLDASGRVFDNFRFVVALTMEQTVSTGSSSIGLAVRHQNTSNELFCELYQLGGNTAARYLGLEDTFGVETNSLFSWQTGGGYILTMTRSGESYTCSVAGPNGPRMVTARSIVEPTSGAAVELRAFGITARLDWVHVVGP